MNDLLNTIEINGNKLQVDNLLLGFEIYQKQSSNVEYFGIDHGNGRLFVQFKGGTGAYIYDGVPIDAMHAAVQAESIGKFISSTIVGKYESEKHSMRLIKSNIN